ncbi:MAG: multiple cyclophane-containing RiPP AmcA [Micromonosporaceae bacterium]
MLEPHDSLEERLREIPGIATLVGEAEATWRGRAAASGEPDPAVPGWRTFEDAFPTFYEFTNRPR